MSRQVLKPQLSKVDVSTVKQSTPKSLDRPSFSLRDTRRRFWYDWNDPDVDIKSLMSELAPWYVSWINERLKLCCWDKEKHNFVYWYARKRGDWRYVSYLKYKLEGYFTPVIKRCKDVNLWKLVTLTHLDSGYNSRVKMSEDWNKLLTALKKRYKDKYGTNLLYFRVFELQKRGSMHVHFIVYGIKSKTLLESWIDKNWDGVKDVQTPRKLKAVYYYLRKYLTKGHENIEQTALMWIWGVRAWSTNFHSVLKLDPSVWLDYAKDNSNRFVFFGVWKTKAESMTFEGFLKKVGWYGVLYWFRVGDGEMFEVTLAEALRSVGVRHGRIQYCDFKSNMELIEFV